MGATTFYTQAEGKNADNAFKKTKDDAYYQHGHSGYTGTIAEKPSYVQFKVPDGMTPTQFINAIENAANTVDSDEDEPKADNPVVRRAAKLFNDKWGPAVCVEVKTGVFVFFGFASE